MDETKKDIMPKNISFLRLLILSISLLASVVCKADKQAANTNTKDTSGKFHLIYLVSAVDLKPGTEVFVDPVFFTDGKDIKGFHQYCKAKKKPLTDENIYADMAVIHNYCTNQLFSVTPKDYHILNNHGVTLKISDVNFASSKSVIDEPVMMGHAKIIAATEGSIKPLKLLRADTAPQYFFLMAKDKGILENIVPISPEKSGETQSLLERARQFAEKVKGTSNSGTHYKLLATDFESKDQVMLANPIFSDFDSDGRLDLAVGLQAIYLPKADIEAPSMSWLGVTYIMGNQFDILGYWPVMEPNGPYKRLNMSGSSYKRYLSHGYPVMTPLAVIRVGNKHYSLRYILNLSMKHSPGLFLEHTGKVKSLEKTKLLLWKLNTPK